MEEETERVLLEIFASGSGKMNKWLRTKLIKKGVESQFADNIAKHKAASDHLLNLDPDQINNFVYSLIKEFEEAGFGKEIALRNPGRLRELEHLGLPITASTIYRNPKTLLEHKKNLERLGLSINVNTICLNPKTLLEHKKELERLGLPVNTFTIYRNPKTLLEHKKELERLGLPITPNTICLNPKLVAKNFLIAEKRNSQLFFSF